jgi:hypothetical protein
MTYIFQNGSLRKSKKAKLNNKLKLLKYERHIEALRTPS